MKNPSRALRDWQQRRLSRARAGGGLHVFWLYMSAGLVWSLFMFGTTALIDLCFNDWPRYESVQSRALIYFAGGMLFGLLLWMTQETAGASGPDERL